MTRQRNQTQGLLGFALAILALSSAASAQQSEIASLRNFQLASADTTIPRVCLQVYNEPIQGCTDTEFINAQCSPGCIRGVLQIQQNIQDACAGVETNPRTLLGQALLGQLVRVLCTEQGASIPPDATTRPATRTISIPSPTPTVGNGGDNTPPPLVPAPPLSTTRGDGGDDEPEETPGPAPNGVGGSPFDIVAQAASGRTTPLLVQAVAVAAGLAVVLLR